MATNTLRYLQDENDPLNQLLAGGQEPATPDVQPPNPYKQDVPAGLLAAPQQPEQSPPPVEAAPPPPQQQEPPAAPQQPARDAELEAAFRNAEMQGLQHGGFEDKPYGVAEGLRDNGAALIASILDIGFNKGRGLGGIVGATANEVGRQEAGREAARKEARDFALKAHGQKDDALQRQRLDYLYASLGNKQASQGATQNRFDLTRNDRNDPNSQRNATAIAQAFGQAQARTQGGIEAKHDYNPMLAQDQANIAGASAAATTGARIGTEHEAAPITQQDAADLAAAQQGARIQTDLNFAPQTNQSAADKAGAVAQAQIAPEIAKQQQMTPIINDRSNNGVGAGLSADGIARANPGLNVSDPGLLQQALKTRYVNQKTMDDIKAANRGSEIVERLHDTADAYQQMVKADPSSIAGPQAAELRRQYKAHAQEYAGVIAKVSGNASLRSHDEALSLVPDIHNPYAVDGIKGLWSPLEANINGNLGAIGISAKPPAFLGGQQAQSGAGDRLPVTSGPLPKVNTVIGAQPPSNDLVTVNLNGERAQVPRAQAMAMQKLNPALEIQ